MQMQQQQAAPGIASHAIKQEPASQPIHASGFTHGLSAALGQTFQDDSQQASAAAASDKFGEAWLDAALDTDQEAAR